MIKWVRSRLRLPEAFLLWMASGSLGLSGPAHPAMAAELKDGDRVALIGDTFIEREQVHGYLETELVSRFSDRNIIFRNLGWSGDTPAGISRASFDFDKPGKGFEKLMEQIKLVQPSVIILGYGMASSFAGAAGLADFKHQTTDLISGAKKACTNTELRFIILSPIQHENLGSPFPFPGPHNTQLKLYVDALRGLAGSRGFPFVDLFDLPGVNAPKAPHLTDNGIHLDAYGYAKITDQIETTLGWKRGATRIVINGKASREKSVGGTLDVIKIGPESVRFKFLAERLPAPAIFGNLTSPPQLVVDGLKRGRYQLSIDGAPVRVASPRELASGVALDAGPDLEQTANLKTAIFDKNNLCFDRYRPQNETYLFGFRKYEQGQNAKEIPMFDTLIQAKEKEIEELKKPRWHEYSIDKISEKPNSNLVVHHPAVPKTSETRPETNTLPQFEIAPGFEVKLFAESPQLAKPIQMNFDPEGRLWIASSAVYPQIKPGQPNSDQIIVLEDKDGDGYAEKSTVFATGLMIPTSVVPGDGGVYVGQSTELLHFRDLDGDGKADERKVVLSGFGTEDTHHMVHTLRWGPDGRLYFNQSIYIHTYIETPHGVERLNSGGSWHLRTTNQKLGVFVKGFCNPWGHAFDEFGESFFTDGAGGQGICFGIPGATYFTYANMRREMRSISPGSYPKFCGLELIRSEHFPTNWQGNAITCDFRAHRVVRFGMEEKGAGYASQELGDLLRTTNVTFRPIDVKLGPDGALYIADWSNPIIQHGEVDFRDPRRDHEHGRIWRVTATGRPLNPRQNFRDASTAELLDQLPSRNSYDQDQARRVLSERGLGIRPALEKWARKQTTENARLQALWMYQCLDLPNAEILEKVLKAHDGRARAAAMRVLAEWHPRLKNSFDLLAGGVRDSHPRVRLEAMRSLSLISEPRSAELILSVLNQHMDDFLDYAAWLSINDLASVWVESVRNGEWKVEGREKQLEFALQAIDPAKAGQVLSQVLKGKQLPRDGSGPWIRLIGLSGDKNLLERVFTQALTNGFDSGAESKALEALSSASSGRGLKPSGDLMRLSALAKSSDKKVREESLRLGGEWKLAQFIPQLLSVAGDAGSPAPLRQTAFDSLRQIGGAKVVAGLTNLVNSSAKSSVKREAVVALSAIELEPAMALAVPLFLEITDEKVAEQFWRSLFKTKDAPAAIARALPKTGIPPPVSRAGLRIAREGGRNEPDLVWALMRGGNLEESTQTLSATELQAIATRSMAEGDAQKGEAIFRRKDLACVLCHAIGGAGGKVGPDLTSIGASAQPDYLVESILYPNRKIKEGYNSVIIETKDGLEFAGVLAREDGEEVVLRDATGKEINVKKANIEKRTTGGSLMPSGLVDSLSAADRLNLYRFLAELGKPGPFDASKGNVARVWKLYPQTLDAAQFGDERVLTSDFNAKPWVTGLTRVDGTLPHEEMDGAMEEARRRDPPALFAAARFQVSGAKEAVLKFTGVKQASAWLDGKVAKFGPEMKLNAGAGEHTVLIKMDARNLPESLRVESSDATFLSAWPVSQDSPKVESPAR